MERVGVVAQDADEAVAAATILGFPVVVKLADPTVPHKTDRGLVRIDLRSAEEVREAVRGFADELGREGCEVLVQPLLRGHQVAVGLVRDPGLGPMVRASTGGGWSAESWDDEVLLLPPVSRPDAARAVRALQLWPKLLGTRGLETVDVGPLEELVVSVGQLSLDVPQLAELTLEPVLLASDGLFCVDIKARLAPPADLDAGIPRRLGS